MVESQRREREEEGARREEVHVPKRHRDRCVRGLRCRSFPPNHGHHRTSFDDGPRKGRKSPMNAPIRRAAPASWGPFCAPRDVCDPRVSCLRVSPTRLRPRFLSIHFPFFLLTPALVSLLNVSLLFPSSSTRALEKLAAPPLLSSPLSSSLEPRRSHEQCSSTLVRRDLNLDNLTCKRNRGRSYVPRSTRDLFTGETGGERSEEFHPHRRLMGSRHFKRVPPVETLNSNYRPMISAKFSPL